VKNLNVDRPSSNQPTPPEPTVAFTANPSCIERGQAATLRWQTINATKVVVRGMQGGDLEVNDSRQVTPADSVTYRLTAYGPGGKREATAHVAVTLPAVLESDRLPHINVRRQLEKAGAKLVTVGSWGYPDLLFELDGRVFAAEVKGLGDRLRPQQKRVMKALSRLEHIYVCREEGKKRTDDSELTVEEMLADIARRGHNE
jgi:hypothetical protein